MLYSLSFVSAYGGHHINIKDIVGHLNVTASTASYFKARDSFVCSIYELAPNFVCVAFKSNKCYV